MVRPFTDEELQRLRESAQAEKWEGSLPALIARLDAADEVIRVAGVLLKNGGPSGPSDGAFYASEDDAENLRAAIEKALKTAGKDVR